MGLIRFAPKLARLGGFVASVYVAFLCVSTHAVEAEVRELALGVGEQMMRFPGDRIGAARTLSFNGAEIQMRSGIVNDSLENVLDLYEERCQQQDGELGEQLEELMEGWGDVDRSATDSVVRWDARDRGVVVCLAQGEERTELDLLTSRLSRFLESGDLSEAGGLRYLFATTEGEKTHLLTIWSDSELNIYRMFPANGEDAEGQDFAEVPRMPGTQRVLSAMERERGYGVTAYFTDASVEDIDRFYRAELRESGFAAVEAHDGEHVDIEGARFLTFAKDGTTVSLSVAPSGSPEHPARLITLLRSEEE